MEQDQTEPIPEEDSPPGVAYQHFRSSIERYTKAKILDWTFANFASLELKNSKIATIIGINKGLITKWLARKQPVALDNVAPLAYAFAVSVAESRGWGKPQLALKRYLPLPREIAHAAFMEVREILADGGSGVGGYLGREEFWWLFHLLSDNRWLKAAADDEKNGVKHLYDRASEHKSTRLYHVYSNKIQIIEWHLNDDSMLSFDEVRPLVARWFRPWMYGITGTAGPLKNSGPPSNNFKRAKRSGPQ